MSKETITTRPKITVKGEVFADELIDKIREALELHYSYPEDSQCEDTFCPITNEAFKALVLLHLEVKHTQEAIEDLRAHYARRQSN